MTVRLARLWPLLFFLLVCASGVVLFDRQRSSSLTATLDPELAQLCQSECDGLQHELRERRLAACLCRIVARRRIAREVIAGRLTLLQAAERFRDLSEATADFSWHQFRDSVPGSSDDERFCRSVIGVVRGEVDHQPNEVRLHVHRLETELEGYLHSGRPLLPEYGRPGG